MPFNPKDKAFYHKESLEQEERRVYEICHGCRRCFNLCPSFNVLFDRMDASGKEAEGLVQEDLNEVRDLCYECKLCYNHCPYTPPHRWDIDFPRMLLRAKAVKGKEEGISFADRLFGNVDFLGTWASRFAFLFNPLTHLKLNRIFMEKILGVHRDRNLPLFHHERFSKWFRKRAAKKGIRKVAIFATCFVEYNDPEVGKAMVEVLERNGCELLFPKQRCCGMPYLDGGDIASAMKNIRTNSEALSQAVDAGYDIVIPGPTCSYMLKQEYPIFLPDDKTAKISKHTFDVSEYLMKLQATGELVLPKKGMKVKIAYHLPCHLKAQNIGYKSRDLLKQIPGAEVEVVERCSGHDGTWGMKKEYFNLSMEIGEKLFNELKASEPNMLATDCPLASLQIEKGMGQKPLHPVQILKRAYEEDCAH